MSSWSTKHQVTYAGIVILVTLSVLGFAGYKIFLDKEISCFDNLKNGQESGIDCGGTCLKLCPMDTVKPVVIWQRMSQVSKGLYNTLAYVENSNPIATTRNLPYLFKLYDKEGLVVGQREGVISLPAKKISPIFEGSIDTGERTAIRSTFEFEAEPVWERQQKDEPKLAILDKVLTRTDTLPRLDVTIENQSVETIKHADVIAILYGGNGNAIAFSRSAVDQIKKGEKQKLVFTWREPFATTITKIEIVSEVSF